MSIVLENNNEDEDMFANAAVRIEKITGINFDHLNNIFDGKAEKPYLEPPRKEFFDIVPFLNVDFAFEDGNSSKIHLLITEDDRLFAGRTSSVATKNHATPIQVGVVPPNSYVLVQEIYEQVTERFVEHSQVSEIILMALERCIEPKKNLALMRHCREHNTAESKLAVKHVLDEIQSEITHNAFH